jgi:hypothetical protein
MNSLVGYLGGIAPYSPHWRSFATHSAVKRTSAGPFRCDAVTDVVATATRAFPRHADEWLGGITAVRRRLIRDAWLVLPEVFEPVRRQGRVADCGHDRSVAEIGLDGASVVDIVCEI